MMSLVRAMEMYHRLIVEDDVRNIPAARRALKRARRRLGRAEQWGVRYDQAAYPTPAVQGLRQADAKLPSAVPIAPARVREMQGDDYGEDG